MYKNCPTNTNRSTTFNCKYPFILFSSDQKKTRAFSIEVYHFSNLISRSIMDFVSYSIFVTATIIAISITIFIIRYPHVVEKQNKKYHPLGGTVSNQLINYFMATVLTTLLANTQVTGFLVFSELRFTLYKPQILSQNQLFKVYNMYEITYFIF